MMHNHLGIRIKQLANNKKLSIKKLEEIAELKINTVRHIIVGKSKNPTLSTLIKICNALKCSFYDLLNEGEVFQNQNSSSKINTYANTKWDYNLFITCIEAVQRYLTKYELSFNLSKMLVLIMDLYLDSLAKNDNQMDEKSAEWLIKKLKVSIPVKSQMIENSLGIKIKQLATNKILPIAKLEKIAGLQNGVVRDIIIGKSENPTLNTLTKICNVLECSVYDLLDNEEIFQKYNLLTAAEPYVDAEWDYIIFIKCVEILGKYLDKHSSTLALSNAISLTMDLYLYSLLKNNRQILDEKSAVELLEKLTKNITTQDSN